MDPRVRKDGQLIFYVDESGDINLNNQGDYYIFAGLLTSNPGGVETLARATKNQYYPQRAELKSAKMSVEARTHLLSGLVRVPDARVIVHVVSKNEIKRPDTMLGDEKRFYKRFYANLLKTALGWHTHGIHVVTDQHHATQEGFEHFENCLKFVNGQNRVLSVNPVCSTQEPCIQVADVLAGTLQKKLRGTSRHGACWDIVKPIRMDHWNNVFPYTSSAARKI